MAKATHVASRIEAAADATDIGDGPAAGFESACSVHNSTAVSAPTLATRQANTQRTATLPVYVCNAASASTWLISRSSIVASTAHPAPSEWPATTTL